MIRNSPFPISVATSGQNFANYLPSLLYSSRPTQHPAEPPVAMPGGSLASGKCPMWPGPREATPFNVRHDRT
jgi:hypothetical protein